jgi:hypothetical protein
MERLLSEGLGINTCGEMLEKRALLYHVFSHQTATWLLSRSVSRWVPGVHTCGLRGVSTPHSRSLGIDKAGDHKESSGGRKGISKERTFWALRYAQLRVHSSFSIRPLRKNMCGPCSRPAELMDKLKELCTGLAADMKEEGLAGKTVTLKLKTVEFDVRTRAQTAPHFVSSAEQLFAIAQRLLQAELPISVRLMGVRVSSFRPQLVAGQRPLDGYLTERRGGSTTGSASASPAQAEAGAGAGAGTAASPAVAPAAMRGPDAALGGGERLETFHCPVCSRSWADVRMDAANRHVEECLQGDGRARSPGEAHSPRPLRKKTGRSQKRKKEGPPQAARLERFFKKE